MKITHLCLGNYYSDGYSYQENELVRQHVHDGHRVSIIASTEIFNSAKKTAYTKPASYLGSEGAWVTRLPYCKLAPAKIMRKVRVFKGLREKLQEEPPDVLVCHGISGAWLLEVARFKRNHPKVRVFADNHADYNNSAQGFISRKLLHRGLYRAVIQKSLRAIESVLCISTETQEFAQQMYDIPERMTEFYPLGGHVFDDDEYFLRRSRARRELAVTDERVVFLQTGKFDAKKKLIESVSAFTQSTIGVDFSYIIAGHVADEFAAELDALIQADPRVRFLGWKNAQDLQDLLCAADVYVQPGSQSATMQMSLAARCAVILADVKAHRPYMSGNGWLVSSNEQLVEAMAELARDPNVQKGMSVRSHEIANRLLDYRKLAARFYCE